MIINRKAFSIETAPNNAGNLYKFLFDHNTMPMVIWDFETLNIIDVNDQAISVYGYSREEFLELNIRDIRPTEDIGLLEEVTKDEHSYGAIHKKTWRHLKKNGELMHMEVSGYLIDLNNRKAVITQNYDLTEKVLTENQLRQSEERYRLLFQKSPIPKLIYELKTLKILEVNDMAVSHYGYSREEFLNMTILDYRPKDEIQSVDDALKNATLEEKAIPLGIFNHLKKDKTQIKVEVTGYRINFKNTDCMMVVLNDITEKHHAQTESLRRNTFIETALDNLPIGIAINNTDDGAATFVNKRFAEIYGWPMESMTDIGAFFRNVYPDPEYRAKIRGMVLEDIASRDPHRMKWQNIRINTAKGTEKIINAQNIPVYDQDLMISTVEDVTEKVKAESDLKKSNERFDIVIRATLDVIYDWDIEKGTLFWAERFSENFGHNYHGMQPDKNSWHNNVHPDDIERVLRDIDELISGLNDRWQSQYRFRKADGTYAFIIDNGLVLRDIDNLAIRMVGSIRDISHRKIEEQRLKLFESVVTNANDAVLITEAEPFEEPGPRILYVNDAFTKMTGYTADEVIGKTPRILQGPKSDREALRQMGNALRHWQTTEITTINYKKNGDEFWINFSVTPVADEKGWYTHWIAIERDVSEQMLAEQKLRTLYTERNAILESIGDGFFAIDNSYNVTYWNNVAERVMKKNREEILGKDLRQVYPDSPGRITYDFYQKAIDTKQVQRFDVYTAEVNTWFEVIVYPSETGLSIYFRDISERLIYLNTIEAQNKKLREIAWTQSHLTRAPVANIIGLLGLLENSTLFDDDKSIINHLLKSTEKLDQIIIDIVQKSNEFEL